MFADACPLKKSASLSQQIITRTLVGCVPSAFQPYVLWWPVPSEGVGIPSTMSRVVYIQTHPPLWHTCSPPALWTYSYTPSGIPAPCVIPTPSPLVYFLVYPPPSGHTKESGTRDAHTPVNRMTDRQL